MMEDTSTLYAGQCVARRLNIRQEAVRFYGAGPRADHCRLEESLGGSSEGLVDVANM